MLLSDVCSIGDLCTNPAPGEVVVASKFHAFETFASRETLGSR